MVISASLPTAIVPFLGYNPNILAGFVQHTSTNLFMLILPFITPSEKINAILSSTPGAPLGHLVKSSFPSCLSLLNENGQWSVAIVCIYPSLIPCHKASQFSELLRGGLIIYFNPSLFSNSYLLSSSNKY